jgi:hypothetical protein
MVLVVLVENPGNAAIVPLKTHKIALVGKLIVVDWRQPVPGVVVQPTVKAPVKRAQISSLMPVPRLCRGSAILTKKSTGCDVIAARLRPVRTQFESFPFARPALMKCCAAAQKSELAKPCIHANWQAD